MGMVFAGVLFLLTKPPFLAWLLKFWKHRSFALSQLQLVFFKKDENKMPTEIGIRKHFPRSELSFRILI
jgi:hypothetical protein